jgi:mRNA interferase MazF
MPNYFANDVVLIRYPFSESSESKVRPAIIINAPHISKDIFIVPLTSKTNALLPGEFVIEDWSSAGLNVVTAVKRGIYTVHEKLVIKKVGSLSEKDAEALKISLTSWIEMS